MERLLAERVVKLEARFEEQTYQIEVEPEDVAGAELYRLKVTGPDGEEQQARVQLLKQQSQRWVFLKDGRIEDVLIRPMENGVAVDWKNHSWLVGVYSPRDRRLHSGTARETDRLARVKALMPGKIIKVIKKSGEKVEQGEGVVVLEAMKMQNEIRSPKAGTITSCELKPGQTVNTGQALFEVE